MKRLLNILGAIGLAAALLAVVLFAKFLLGSQLTWPLITERFAIFATIFLGIFIEAAPFLLLGTLASGAVEVFLDPMLLSRLAPRNKLGGAVTGALMGLIFPVCECGVVPLSRRLLHKGLPLPVAIAFLLASPVVNPIVIISTYTAFGWGPMLWLRVGGSMLIAATVGLTFAFAEQPYTLLQAPALAPMAGGSGAPDHAQHDHDHDHHQHQHTHTGTHTPSRTAQLRRMLTIAGDEFFEMGRYLVIGAMLAALMQTFIPQSALLALGSGPLLSILVMLAFAVLLSICSTVDAFVALAFVNSFSLGSILSFLVFGPMVDIKSTLMYLQVFKRRAVAYLILLPLLMSIALSLVINLYTGL